MELAKIDRDFSDGVRAVGFICSLMVVAIHCWSPKMWFAGMDSCGAFEAGIRFLLSCSFSRMAVPMFFVLTGFFLANGMRGGGLKSYVSLLRKRFMTLYVPFVLWNLINVVMYMVMGGKYDCVWGNWPVLCAKVFGYNPYMRLGCMQFWYLQSVILFVLLSPFAAFAMRRRWTRIFLFGGLICGMMWNHFHYLPLPLAISNYFWMCVGMRLERWNGKGRRILWVPFFVIFVGALALRVYGGVSCNLSLYDFADWLIVPSGVAVVWLNLRKIGMWVEGVGDDLFTLSFWIYACHTMFITIAIFLFDECVSGSGLYFLKLLVAICGAIASGIFLRRFCPKTFLLLTGGRG